MVFHKYYLQYERRCSIGYTSTNRKRVTLCQIQHRREYCKVIMKLIHVNVRDLQNGEDPNDFIRENSTKISRESLFVLLDITCLVVSHLQELIKF